TTGPRTTALATLPLPRYTRGLAITHRDPATGAAPMPRAPQPRRVVVVRYQLADGSRCTKETPGANKVTERTDTYFAKIGGKRVSLGTNDLGQAWIELRRLQRREADRQAGILDDVVEQAARPLAEHVEDWLRVVTDEGGGEMRVQLLRTRVFHLAELAG